MKYVKNISRVNAYAAPAKAQVTDDIFGQLIDYIKGLLDKGAS